MPFRLLISPRDAEMELQPLAGMTGGTLPDTSDQPSGLRTRRGTLPQSLASCGPPDTKTTKRRAFWPVRRCCRLRGCPVCV